LCVFEEYEETGRKKVSKSGESFEGGAIRSSFEGGAVTELYG
jgi:hypothetical protein